MSYSKYNDPSALICEMCLPMTQEEMLNMADLGAEIKTNSEIAKEYPRIVKMKYLNYIREKEENNYTPIRFSELDAEIREQIKETTLKKEYPLLPEYAKFEDSKNVNKDNQNHLLAKIADIKKQIESN